MTNQYTIDSRRTAALAEFEKLIDIIDTLRSENGCPWDRKQTPESLKPYIEEEAYEVIDAIDGGKPDHICEELGDLLLQIMLQSQISFEAGTFDISDVISGLSTKMIARHPHVFADAKADTADDVLINWEKIKATEKTNKGLLDGIPRQLPSLSRAARIGSRAAKVGFDWITPEGVRSKVIEELEELDNAIANAAADEIEHELGDLLFSVAQWGRHLEQHPEEALRKTSDRFARRFALMTTILKDQGFSLEQSSPEQMEAAWQQAKRI